jgi:PEP-CTERM motif
MLTSKLLARVVGGLALALMLPAIASAGPLVLTIEDLTTGNTATVYDQGSGDVDLDEGEVAFADSLGNFIINITTGTSTQSTDSSLLDLTSVNVSLFKSGTLQVTLQDSYNVDAGSYVTTAILNGTLVGGSSSYVEAETWVDGTEVLSAESGAGSFSATDYTTFVTDGFYSMLSQVTVSFGRLGGVAAFDLVSMASLTDAAAVPTPEPATMFLFSGGLLGIAFVRRRRSA